MSHHVGFAVAPASPTVRLQRIDFVRLAERRVLVVVVSTGGQVTHKVVETDEACEATVLTQAANYINTEFSGAPLQDVRAAVIRRLQHERMWYDALAARALRLTQTGLGEPGTDDRVHVQGASLLLEDLVGPAADKSSMLLEALRALFRMMEEKHRLLEILTQYLDEAGLTVVIGSEHSSPDMQPFSLVASTFSDGERTGAVGVIGPTRMRYQRTIAMVDSVSATMTRMLERP